MTAGIPQNRTTPWTLLAIASVLTLVVTGIGLLVPPASAQTATATTAHATVSAPNQTLKKGCHTYRFNYRVAPQELDWMLEVWVYDAARTAQAYKLIASGEPGAPLRSSVSFTLCSAAVRATGTFLLKAQFSTIIAGRNAPMLVKPAAFKVVKTVKVSKKKPKKK